MNEEEIRKLKSDIFILNKKIDFCLQAVKEFSAALQNEFQTTEYIIVELEKRGILPTEEGSEETN